MSDFKVGSPEWEKEHKEKFDREWNTCRHCSVKDGDDKHNYVMDGQCRKCRDKLEKERDFKEGQEDGEVSRDDSIMCPYCGYVVEDDLCEYHNSRSFDCPECEKECELSIEYTIHYTTTKKVTEK